MDSDNSLTDADLKRKIQSLNQKASEMEHDLKILKSIFSHLKKQMERFKRELKN